MVHEFSNCHNSLAFQEHPHPLIFVHIPKTGGTSFGNALRVALLRQSVVMFTSNKSLDKFRSAPKKINQSQVQVVGGHIPFPEFRNHGFDGWAFTVIREPRDRIISQYHFFNSSRHRDHKDLCVSTPGDYLGYLRKNSVYSNIQCRFVSGEPTARAAIEKLKNDRLIAVSLDQIDKLAKSISSNWTKSLEIPRDNVSLDEPQGVLSDLLNEAPDLYDEDLKLYEYVQANSEGMIARVSRAVNEGQICLTPRVGYWQSLCGMFRSNKPSA